MTSYSNKFVHLFFIFLFFVEAKKIEKIRKEITKIKK